MKLSHIFIPTFLLAGVCFTGSIYGDEAPAESAPQENVPAPSAPQVSIPQTDAPQVDAPQIDPAKNMLVHKKFELPAFDDILVSGLVKIEVVRDIDEQTKTYSEIIAPSDLPINKMKLSLKTSHKNATLLVEGIADNNSTSAIPHVVLHLKKTTSSLSISTKPTTKKGTEIYVDKLEIDHFTYKGQGNSSLVVNELIVKEASLTTTDPRQKKRNTSADIEISGISAQKLTLSLADSSNVVLQGRTNAASFHTPNEESAVDIEAQGLRVAKCDVDIGSQSSLKVSVEKSIKGHVRGKANLFYYQTPKTKSRLQQSPNSTISSTIVQ